MKNPLDSVGATVTLGVVFAIIVMALPQTPDVGGFHQLGLGRWAHIVTGIFWIGLLYYFNVAQIPALAAANADTGGPGGAGIISTSHRVRCCGSAGWRSPPGSRAVGCSVPTS